MRVLTIGLIGGLAALSLAACNKKDDAAKPAQGADAAATATADAGGGVMMPKRKPGLWEQSMVAEGAPAMTMKVCLDEATDAKMSAVGNQAGKDACSENKMSKGLDGAMSFDSTCDMGTGGVSKTRGKVTGDFNSNYTVDATIVTTGAAVPQMNRTSTMKMTAKWVGACPAGMKPGDVDMGGMVINMTGMKAPPATQK